MHCQHIKTRLVSEYQSWYHILGPVSLQSTIQNNFKSIVIMFFFTIAVDEIINRVVLTLRLIKEDILQSDCH